MQVFVCVCVCVCFLGFDSSLTHEVFAARPALLWTHFLQLLTAPLSAYTSRTSATLTV